MAEELYTIPANTRTPMLIVYLLDISKSMHDTLGDKRRIDIVHDTLEEVVLEMVSRSMRGATIQKRYRIAMFAYNDSVIDVLGGVWDIDKLAVKGIPNLNPGGGTNTAAAFVAAEKVLRDTEAPRVLWIAWSPLHGLTSRPRRAPQQLLADFGESDPFVSYTVDHGESSSAGRAAPTAPRRTRTRGGPHHDPLTAPPARRPGRMDGRGPAAHRRHRVQAAPLRHDEEGRGDRV